MTEDDRMKVIGVTGGMGAGKSEVLRIMEQDFGARVILADEVGRRLMEPGGATYEKILSEFGREFAGADGKIDRQKLAREIFGDEEKRRKINSIVHPLVRQEIEEEIAEARAEKLLNNRGVPSCIAVESALLAEGGLEGCCDTLWYIYASPETRIRRVMENRGYTRTKAEQVINSQMEEEEYRRICSVMIDNSGALSDTRSQVSCEMRKILDNSGRMNL
ncbi:dephospho-CoA kinase [Cuneatibacter caecimuris]|uniref:Dephospho-CoA kinase n=1 Tax=Cuneatibacter caecimuris TaxID=1796618 RepID=A0A4Q7PRV3_9FIRM|nr:dephospho-CoA kinase [Cuneatibacter caecimuris]RZT02000.1 dephospho-CoA kinase [Cuneatibacter caecimuris]